MKKYMQWLLLFILTANQLWAQEERVEAKLGQRSSGSMEINGQTFPCAVIEYNASPDVVENALIGFMSQRGKKPSSRKGTLMFRGVNVPHEETHGPLDAFVQIEAKSRSEKDKSVVKVLFTKPDQIADKKSKDANSAAVATVAMSAGFVGGFNNAVTESAHQSDITLQEKQVQLADRDLKALEKEIANLQNQLTNLQKEIANNQQLQETAKAKLELETKKLETIRAKKLLKMD